MNPEQMVIGACLLTPASIRFARSILEPHHFHSMTNATVFRAAVQLTTAGEPVEPFTVAKKAEELGARGVDSVELFRWVEQVGSASSIEFYADQVRESFTRRTLSGIAGSLMRASGDESAQPSEAAHEALEAIKALQSSSDNRMRTKTLEEILSVADDHDWLIPGLLERGDRVVITGFEGGGKTTWIRQMAICMAAGIHPVTLDHLEAPLRVLVIDAENSETQWRAQVRGMTAKAAQYGLANPAPAMEIFAGRRINITKDATLGEIHRLVDEHSPDVLAIGPLYKIVSTGINNDEEAAPVISALDSLRERGLALIMEGHAAKGSSHAPSRDLAPRGSAALMGWPEFGFGLHPDQSNPDVSLVTRWRGDRDANRDWPKELSRGGPFPWTADLVAPNRRQDFYGWKEAS